MKLNRIFVVSVIVTLAWMILMGSLVKPLNSKEIVAFELAKTPEVATAILKEWQANDLIGNARKSIYLDFVFLVLYSLSIGIGCVMLPTFSGSGVLVRSGLVLSRIVPIASCCDVIENLAMLKTLSGSITSLSVTIAFWFAVIKFLIVALSLLFLLSCLFLAGVSRITKK